ncbi:GPR1/FUN34/YaaH-class plasma membrane protein-like protein [Trichodelitschia bisporula]|uniref:GPR1/FUN34/YaaH-class plasma membrane protein-like protein n=1 Tax=Trichodelitschia bisporula TaxID=703511 RepID=A0A6G1I5G3_9PEZI|nr:GPR1/FUN34/YaaH-class plasma membrane protein-like protein [Trichodelitschia bisporula]
MATPQHAALGHDHVEKDFSKGYTNGTNGVENGGYRTQNLHPTPSNDEALHRIRTAGSINISPELFEQLYLSPQTAVKGDLRKTYGNPTPVALVGFLMCATPLAMDLMGWRGTGGAGVGAATVGNYYFYGGMLMVLGAIGEWLLGNTFPCVVFATFSAFWFSFGATLTPSFNAVAAYTDPTVFYNSYAFYLIAFGLINFIFMIASLRTNICFFAIFFSLVICLPSLAGSYFHAAQGNMDIAHKLQVVAGAFLFICDVSGFWLVAGMLVASVDLGIPMPVGDLTHIFKSGTEKRKAKAHVATGRAADVV